MTVAITQRKIPSHTVDHGPRQFSLKPAMDLIRDTWEGSNATGPGHSGDIRGSLVKQTAVVLGVNTRYVYRWLHDGLGVYQADAIAVILGRHPVEIWSDWYELSVPTEEEIEASENAQMIERRRYMREAQRRSRERRAAFQTDPHAWRREVRPTAGPSGNAGARYIAEGADQGEQVSRLLEVLGASK
jgi:hypothetical protein